jgi:peptide deformylase
MMKMIYNLVDTYLKTKLEKFDFNSGVDAIQLAKELTESLLTHKGLGLSANQIGLQSRACVILSNPVLVLFNPRIVDFSETQVLLDEGCLSFPGLVVPVKRSESIRCRFEQPNGETVTRVFNGMTARVIQHEIDHLDGILFYDRANPYHKDKAFKKWKKKSKQSLRATAA